MSSMDLYEDGFPHSTREGWERGCRGSGCPGKLDYGFSCTEAQMRYAGDYAYQKRVLAGLSPAEIMEAEEQEHAAAVRASRSLVGSKLQKATDEYVEVAAATVARETAPKPVDVAEGPAPRKVGGQPKPIVHGTPNGYQKGCRDGLACPKNADGLSCLDAARAYHREYSARRKANAGALLGQRNAREQDVVVLSGSAGVVAERDARIVELESQLAEVRAAWAVVQRVLGATS